MAEKFAQLSNTITVTVSELERFPEYVIAEKDTPGPKHTLEVDPDTLKRWQHIMNEFQAVQDEIEKLINEQDPELH